MLNELGLAVEERDKLSNDIELKRQLEEVDNAYEEATKWFSQLEENLSNLKKQRKNLSEEAKSIYPDD